MLIAPTRKRNDLFVWGIISEPIVAACPEPMPGRNEQRGAEMIVADEALRNSFFVSLIVFSLGIFCFITCDLSFRLIISADVPNKPVNRGRRGSLIGELRDV